MRIYLTTTHIKYDLGLAFDGHFNEIWRYGRIAVSEILILRLFLVQPIHHSNGAVFPLLVPHLKLCIGSPL